VSKVMESIIERLQKQCGAELRKWC
jgi:hypothetical protein